MQILAGVEAGQIAGHLERAAVMHRKKLEKEIEKGNLVYELKPTGKGGHTLSAEQMHELITQIQHVYKQYRETQPSLSDPEIRVKICKLAIDRGEGKLKLYPGRWMCEHCPRLFAILTSRHRQSEKVDELLSFALSERVKADRGVSTAEDARKAMKQVLTETGIRPALAHDKPNEHTLQIKGAEDANELKDVDGNIMSAPNRAARRLEQRTRAKLARIAKT